MAENESARRRILVVEDEMLIAIIIEDAVKDSGGQVVGPAATLEKALKIAEEREFDADSRGHHPWRRGLSHSRTAS
jgi:CheY-like chemotaxis protein